ncbi:MAG: ribosomal L7Ae/L30e/S12e/Gadd45 family protein [Clostridia bacterium]|nr:ribosomal L7Ae/L30e/S12e/Gadd45 family protein [Clostridia bacterium]
MHKENEVASVEGKLLRLLGLCRRAGKTVMGTNLVCSALADRKKPYLVLLAADVSPATEKKVRNKCLFYRVRLEKISVSNEALGKALGKLGGIAAVAVTEEHFATELIRLNTTGKDPRQNEGEGA